MFTEHFPRRQRGSEPPLPDWSACAAFLDFDGTLAPLAPSPTSVRLPARERGIVGRLIRRCGGAVAILTGRDLAAIGPYFDGLPVAFGGSHGAEMMFPDLDAERVTDLEALDLVRDRIVNFGHAHGLLVEHKAAALAIHYRGQPDLAQSVIDLIDVLAGRDRNRLKPLHGNMVSEVTLRAYDKGLALREIMCRPPFLDRSPVAVGDDTTDEDAIRAAQSLGGTGLRIGTTQTAADHVFQDRDAFVDWLEKSLGDA